MGDSISEGVVESYVKNVGEFVEADEIVARIETDKVTVDILSQHAGVITKYYAEEGDTVEVGGDFLEIDTDAKAPEGGAKPAAASPEPAATPTPTPAAPTPAPQAAPTPAPQPAAPTSAAPKPVQGGATTQQTAKKAPSEITGARVETRVKMSKMRQTISRRLKEAQNTNALLTTFNEIDMGDYMDMRKEVQDAFVKKHGVKLGFMSAFMKASV
mmetsp:Transcript_18781/g.25436  ORF Transcript_18781/g.25436 Transcript_18781/m.25436 type:complete len:214 (+) Transcript_18781:217-858(+)